MRRFAFALTLAAPALLCTSCARTGEKPLYPVRGQVLYQGKPAKGALVVFHPLGDKPAADAPNPHAEVAEDGSFTLTTAVPQDGAAAGEYAVTVEWWRSRAALGRRDIDQPPLNLLPPRYASAQTSKLKVRVTEGENQLQPLNLTR